MRNDRPNLIAGSSPEWTMRYTVMVDTRITSATSPTVRKCMLEKGEGMVSLRVWPRGQMWMELPEKH